MKKSKIETEMWRGRSAIYRYFICAALLILTLIGMPLQCIARALPFQKSAFIIPRIYHWLGLKLLDVKIFPCGHVCDRRPVLIVSNHISWLDIAVLSSLAPVSFIAKSEVARWPVISWLARLQGTVFVNRQSRISTKHTTAEMASRFADREALVLFAEGTSSSGARVLPFRSSLLGAALQHVDSGEEMWVQPVAICYQGYQGISIKSGDRPYAGWYGDMDLIPHFAEIIRKGGIDVSVRWGAPQRIMPHQDRKQLAYKLEREIRILKAQC